MRPGLTRALVAAVLVAAAPVGVQAGARSAGAAKGAASDAAAATDDAAGWLAGAQSARAARSEALARQTEEATRAAREAARLLYRVARLRTQPGVPAAATPAAVRALQRASGERASLASEWARARADEQALAAASASPLTEDARAAVPSFAPPVDGPVLARPGLKRDERYPVYARTTQTVWLARYDAAVRAPRAGRVHAVAAAPGGGFTVTLDHGEGWSSVVTGFRRVTVRPGAVVTSGETLGSVGRTLDGAPVVAAAVYRGRVPLTSNPFGPVLRPDPRTVAVRTAP